MAIPAVSAFSRTYLLEAINNQPYAEATGWFKMWEDIGLLAFSDLNGDGLILRLSRPNQVGRVSY